MATVYPRNQKLPWSNQTHLPVHWRLEMLWYAASLGSLLVFVATAADGQTEWLWFVLTPVFLVAGIFSEIRLNKRMERELSD